MAYTAEQMIARYIEIRDQIEVISERHSEELRPFNEGLSALEMGLQDVLNHAGGDSIKTPAGTAYRSSHTTAKMEDWTSFINFVLQVGDTELLVRSANKTRVLEHMDAGAVVPGVAMSTVNRINVRRS
jgi:hypothetical protein